ncbi:MAG: hypothetical protein V4676_03750, partial [Bacteroidota bacterium]
QLKKTGTSWYQKLVADTVALYKIIQKKLLENRPYNSATYEQTIRTETVYAFVYRNTGLLFKKLKEVPLLFKDKKNEIEIFLKNKEAEGGSIDQIVLKLTAYLNSLLKPA